MANSGIKPPDDGLCASLSPTALACTGLGASSITGVQRTLPGLAKAKRAPQEATVTGYGERRAPGATDAFSMSP